MQQPPVVKEATSDQQLVKDIESSKIMQEKIIQEKIETTEPPKDQTDTKTADFEPKINTNTDYQNQELKPETVTMDSQENIDEHAEKLVDPGVYKSDQDQTSSDMSSSEIDEHFDEEMDDEDYDELDYELEEDEHDVEHVHSEMKEFIEQVLEEENEDDKINELNL